MDELYTAVINSSAAEDSEEYRKLAREAVDDVNALTFSRIEPFAALTEFQRETIIRACERFICFKRDNAELLNSALKSYSVNGVSMSFGDEDIKCVDGIYIPGDIYALLRRTGLTCRAI